MEPLPAQFLAPFSPDRLLELDEPQARAPCLSGGRRTDYRLAVTVLPHTLDLSAGDVPAVPDDASQPQLTLNQEGN